MTYELINNDCFEEMYYIDDNSVDAIITDPPYGVLKHKIESIIEQRVGGRVYNKDKIFNDVSSISSTIKNQSQFLSSYETVKTGYKARNLVSFIPHNKLGYDMSGKGGGAYNIKHPTVKPVELIKYLIQLTTNESQVILDPFVGTGTTILAGLDTNRTVIGIELFRQYHDIAQQRINWWNCKPKQGRLW